MKILIAENDMISAQLLRKALVQFGHSVDLVADGRDAIAFCLYCPCNLLILDRTLPNIDGLAVLKGLRAAGLQFPIIMLTAIGNVEQRVEGLLAGADDYIVKPFHFSELMARMTVLARRAQYQSEVITLKVHDLVLNLHTHVASRSGESIPLQTKEFTLLELLMRNPGRIITKTTILEHVWDFNFDPRSTVVETHVSRLRSKIDRPFGTHLIHTTRNSGYSIHAPG